MNSESTSSEVLFLLIPEYADWEFALLAPGLRRGFGIWAPRYEVNRGDQRGIYLWYFPGSMMLFPVPAAISCLAVRHLNVRVRTADGCHFVSKFSVDFIFSMAIILSDIASLRTSTAVLASRFLIDI